MHHSSAALISMIIIRYNNAFKHRLHSSLCISWPPKQTTNVLFLHRLYMHKLNINRHLLFWNPLHVSFAEFMTHALFLIPLYIGTNILRLFLLIFYDNQVWSVIKKYYSTNFVWCSVQFEFIYIYLIMIDKSQ